jgi:hypothetical protein
MTPDTENEYQSLQKTFLQAVEEGKRTYEQWQLSEELIDQLIAEEPIELILVDLDVQPENESSRKNRIAASDGLYRSKRRRQKENKSCESVSPFSEKQITEDDISFNNSIDTRAQAIEDILKSTTGGMKNEP